MNPFYYEEETTIEQAIELHYELQRLAGFYAGMTLDNEKKPTAKIVNLYERLWVCTGSISSDQTGYTLIWLQEVTPTAKYTGRSQDPEARGPAAYTGLQFTDRKGNSYTILPHVLEIHSTRFVKATTIPMFPEEAQ